MECRKFASLVVAIAAVLSTATIATVTAARNEAMPFSIVVSVDIRNPFVNIFSVDKSAESCVPSRAVNACSECCDPSICIGLSIFPP
ncbi:hypothetical protein V6N13_080768 [Hibiscus sabdariffa]